MENTKGEMNGAGTKIKFIGGNNDDRIGGNCSVIEHTNEKGEVSRVMFDLGALFAPYHKYPTEQYPNFEAAYPDVTGYFDRVDPLTGEETKASQPVEALFITHAHEDHIGALMSYVRLGYKLPQIKTSRFTKNLIRLCFKANAMTPPEIVTVKAGDNINVGEDMVVEPFNVSHSIIDSLGFHTLTFVDSEAYAGIVNNGDFLAEESMPVGTSFNSNDYLNLLKRKLTTNILIDSTSTVPNGKERIGFEGAVDNTLNVIRQNPDRNILISPVISRSVQNIAVDIETARRLNTKICLEGKWLKLVYEAMQLSGYKDFGDIIYKGNLKDYLADEKISRKYVVCTGAFAQGLQEYEDNQGKDCVGNIPMSAAPKMALDLHRDLVIDKNCLILSRQRIIDEINGQTGPKMLQLMAAKGGKVVMTPCGKKIANFEEVMMQDSGHINAESLAKLARAINENVSGVIYTPIHGNPKQCANTENILNAQNSEVVTAHNMEALIVGKGKADIERSDESKRQEWIAVKRTFPNPLDESTSDIPWEGKLEFYRIDSNYRVIEKIMDTMDVARKSKPGDENYYANVFDDTCEGNAKESNRERKVKLSRKAKKHLSDEEKKARLAKSANDYKKSRQQKEGHNGMTADAGSGTERVRYTKDGKPRKKNRFASGFNRDGR